MSRIDPAHLEAGATVLLEGLETPADAAGRVAASLVDADRCGHGSHGVVRLATMYAPMVAAGTLDPTATPTVDDADLGALRVDGNRGFGQLTARVAVDAAAAVAEDRGTATVGVKNGAHMGRIGEWAERAGVVGDGEVFGEGPSGSVNNAAVCVLIDPIRFTSRGRIREAVRAFDGYLADATLSPAVDRPDAMDGDRPLLPGAPEHLTRERRDREGVPVGDRTLDALTALASDLGAADAFPLG